VCERERRPDLFNAGRAGTASNPACCPPCRLLSLPYRPGGQVFSVLRSTTTHNQCCKVARQKFRPKSSKGATKKKFLAEFWLILPKTGRKGAAENFQNKFLIFSCWPNFLDVLAGNFFGTWQHCTQLGFAVPARPADLPQGGGGGGQRKRLNSGVQLCVSADIISLFHHYRQII
jgi:hypothetical protein